MQLPCLTKSCIVLSVLFHSLFQLSCRNQDADGDGFSVDGDGDCNDNDAASYPRANEICDGQDTDCNGIIEDQNDIDGDGFACDLGYFDCQMSDPTIYPGAIEIVDNGADDNCDGTVDEMDDRDNDHYPSSEDCNDEDPEINPGQNDCDANQVDDDCDGYIDDITGSPTPDSAVRWYRDFDGDGEGDENKEVLSCPAIDGYVQNSDDCDDSNSSINSFSPELCDEIDNNCNDLIDDDDNPEDPSIWYYDFDQDGYGVSSTVRWACNAPEGYVDNDLPEDCDDSRPNIHPNIADPLDGIDNNCDDLVDGITVGCNLNSASSITVALDWVLDYEVVELCGGTYFESISIIDRYGIMIRSRSDEVVMVDGEGFESVFYVLNSFDLVFDALTIRGSDYGINAGNSQVEISRCVVEDNAMTGLRFEGGQVEINSDTTVQLNGGRGSGGYGAIRLVDVTQAAFNDILVQYNESEYLGGALYAERVDTLIVENTIFLQNESDERYSIELENVVTTAIERSSFLEGDAMRFSGEGVLDVYLYGIQVQGATNHAISFEDTPLATVSLNQGEISGVADDVLYLRNAGQVFLYGEDYYENEGGVVVESDTFLSIDRSQFTSNQGTAVNVKGNAGLVIEDSDFEENGSASMAGAVVVDLDAGIVSILNCDFEENWSDTLAGGLTVYGAGPGSAILNNIFVGNIGIFASHLVVEGGDLLVANNRFNDGSANYAAAVALRGGSCQFVNNTLLYNGSTSRDGTLTYYGPEGYGSAEDIIILNNIIEDNTACGIGADGDPQSIIADYNNVYANVYDNYCGGALEGAHDLSQDSRFYFGGLQLKWELDEQSPCIDAGNDVSSLGVTTDYKGTTRPQLEGYDLGYHEYVPDSL